jgi:methane monooxygenase component A beta chain/propane monooxygenase small subunit
VLVYTRVFGESAPQAFLLSGPDATVGELIERVRSVRSAKGRDVSLLGGVVDPSSRLADVGVHEGDLVDVVASGEARAAEPAATLDSGVDLEALKAHVPAAPKRLTEYEEVTQLLQWGAPYHINGDRPSHQVWTSDSTVLRASDWATYRSPDKLYYRTYTSRQAKAERAVSTAFKFAADSGQLAQVDPEHVALMRSVVGALQYPDWGLCVVHQHATRFALSSWIAGATEFMMFDELRHAQLYARVGLAYGEVHEGFDDPRQGWMDDERLQGTRRLIEELLAELDWGKAVVLAGIVIEPVLTSVVHAMLTSRSIRAGDALTPFVCQSIAEDKARHRDSAAEFLQLVATDRAHGESNREHVEEWVRDWLPRAVEAATSLAAGDAAGMAALAQTQDWIVELLESAGLAADIFTPTTVGASGR